MKILFVWIKDSSAFPFPSLHALFYCPLYSYVSYLQMSWSRNFHEELFVTCYGRKWCSKPVGHCWYISRCPWGFLWSPEPDHRPAETRLQPVQCQWVTYAYSVSPITHRLHYILPLSFFFFSHTSPSCTHAHTLNSPCAERWMGCFQTTGAALLVSLSHSSQHSSNLHSFFFPFYFLLFFPEVISMLLQGCGIMNNYEFQWWSIESVCLSISSSLCKNKSSLMSFKLNVQGLSHPPPKTWPPMSTNTRWSQFTKTHSMGSVCWASYATLWSKSLAACNKATDNPLCTECGAKENRCENVINTDICAN